MSLTHSALLGVKDENGLPGIVDDLKPHRNFALCHSSSCSSNSSYTPRQHATRTSQLQLTEAPNQAFSTFIPSSNSAVIKNGRWNLHQKHITTSRRARQTSLAHHGSIVKGSHNHHHYHHHQHQPKAKIVDDSRIRAAFTHSYAFVDPASALLSTMQPSSFRLDGFNDLPIRGGDQPDLHEALRNFLNGKVLPELSEDHSRTKLDKIRFAWFVSAMSAPEICLSILAVQVALRGCSSGSNHHHHRCLSSSLKHSSSKEKILPETSMETPSNAQRKCIEYIRRHQPVEASLAELG